MDQIERKLSVVGNGLFSGKIIPDLVLFLSCFFVLTTCTSRHSDLNSIENEVPENQVADQGSNEYIDDQFQDLPEATLVSNLRESIAMGNSVLLDPEEFAITFEEFQNIDYLNETVLLFANSESRRPVEIGDDISIRTSDWGGHFQEFFSITYTGREDIQRVTAIYVSISTGSEWILVTIEIAYFNLEFYLYNMMTGELIGYQYPCEESIQFPALGMDYVANSCIEEAGWNFMSLSDGSWFSGSMDQSYGDLYYSSPIMFNEYSLLLGSENHVACIVDFSTFESVCKEFDYWLMTVSSDGQWIEVRIGDDHDPEAIGIMAVDCITDSAVECVPIGTPLVRDMPRSDDYWYLGESAWLPDNSGLLYMVELETDGTNNETDEREIWSFDISDCRFEYLARFDLPLRFGDGHAITYQNPPPWLPDGSSVVMSVGEQYYLFNVETAELTPLTEGGILLGAITLP